GVRATGGALPAARMAPCVSVAARSRRSVGLRAGGIRARLPVAVLVSGTFGVLHLAVPDHRERRHGWSGIPRRAGGRVRCGTIVRGGMETHDAGYWGSPRSGSSADGATRKDSSGPRFLAAQGADDYHAQ